MTTEIDLEKLRFPVGKYQRPDHYNALEIKEWIHNIEHFPGQLEEVLKQVNQESLQWRYRPGGWNIQQVVHHCADSHMNAITRFKLALTENGPTISPYLEARWAELADTLEVEILHSMMIIKGVHHRWTILLKSMNQADFEREYYHPEYGRKFELFAAAAMYEWHCRHHLAHVKQALAYKGAFEV